MKKRESLRYLKYFSNTFSRLFHFLGYLIVSTESFCGLLSSGRRGLICDQRHYLGQGAIKVSCLSLTVAFSQFLFVVIIPALNKLAQSDLTWTYCSGQLKGEWFSGALVHVICCDCVSILSFKKIKTKKRTKKPDQQTKKKAPNSKIKDLFLTYSFKTLCSIK